MKYLKKYCQLDERNDFQLNDNINLLYDKLVDSLNNKLNQKPIEKYLHKSGKYIFDLYGFKTSLLLVISPNDDTNRAAGFGRIESSGVTYPTIFIKMNDVTSDNILNYIKDYSNVIKHELSHYSTFLKTGKYKNSNKDDNTYYSDDDEVNSYFVQNLDDFINIVKDNLYLLNNFNDFLKLYTSNIDEYYNNLKTKQKRRLEKRIYSLFNSLKNKYEI
jgi:hypothetical protein